MTSQDDDSTPKAGFFAKPKPVPYKGRPIDGDLTFWGTALHILNRPRGRMAEIRANFLFMFAVIIAVYVTWCVYDRFKGTLPTTVSRLTVLTPTVRLGGRVWVKVDIDRHRVCEREFQWIIQDRTGHRERFQEAPMHAIGNPGPDSFLQDFSVPTNLEPGLAKVRIIWSWQCPENLYEAIYPVTLVLKDVPFEILPATAP